MSHISLTVFDCNSAGTHYDTLHAAIFRFNRHILLLLLAPTNALR